MARVEASVVIDASLAEAWDHFFDERRWREWADGFAAVESAAGYPREGGTLVWRSVPAGRGTVREHVLEHEERRRHRVAFADPQMEGELATAFAIESGRTRVSQVLEYRLRARGPFALLAGVTFVRPQLRRSLERSLAALARDVEDATPGHGAP